jgi:thiamine-phosphate pyrophosphorylase
VSKHFDPGLYVVTDPDLLQGRLMEDQVAEAILGGATMVQLREKALSTRDFIKMAERVKRVTDQHSVPLIINDHLDVMLAARASGLHVGQSDMPAVTARRLLGNGAILGVSVTTVAEAIRAEADGADYLGVGAIFPTGTKPDAAAVGLAELAEITRAVSIPVVAIGGISADNALQLKGRGLRGIAVVSAIFGKPDTRGAAETMRRLARELVADDGEFRR